MTHHLTRTWSGFAPIAEVAVSTDGGASWGQADVDEPVAAGAWQAWRYDWQAQPGPSELWCRATDAAGNIQPVQPGWNLGGCTNNAVQRVAVQVT